VNPLVPEALHGCLADVVLAAGFVLLVLLAPAPALRERVADVALLVFASSAVGAVASLDAPPGWIAGRMLAVDPFGTFFKFVLSLCAMAEVWLSTRSRAEPQDAAPWAAAALAASLLGMFAMITAANVVAAWAGFEVVTLASAAWIAARHRADDAVSSGATDEAVASLLQGSAASATALRR